MKLWTMVLLVLSVTSVAAESMKEKLPEVSHLLKVVCVNGTQYYYHKEDRSGSLSPVVKNGKFLECESNKQVCKKSAWDNSINCE